MDLAADFRARLFGLNTGVLLTGEVAEPVRFVLDPATSQPVLPLPAAYQGEQATLMTPEEAPDVLQLLVTPVAIDPRRAEAADRWLIHFGQPSISHWAMLEIESARRLEDIVDGAELCGEHPFRSQEPALLRQVNAKPEGLVKLARQAAGISPDSARAVAIDPWGLTIRVRFGVMRVPIDGASMDAAATLAALMRQMESTT